MELGQDRYTVSTKVTITTNLNVWLPCGYCIISKYSHERGGETFSEKPLAGLALNVTTYQRKGERGKKVKEVRSRVARRESRKKREEEREEEGGRRKKGRKEGRQQWLSKRYVEGMIKKWEKQGGRCGEREDHWSHCSYMYKHH